VAAARAAADADRRKRVNTRTFKILGFLLTYPTGAHRDAFSECRVFLKQENILSAKTLESLNRLITEMEETGLLDLQEAYVDLFDRTPSLSLHLFEHIHGDSRQRGQALADLAGVYEQAGLVINTEETPDYLPLFLEYVSTLPPEEIRNNLGSIVNILSALSERLKNRGSAYTGIFDALIEAAEKTPDKAAVDSALKEASGAEYDLEQIDREWEEQFAFENTPQTTGQDDGCPKAKEMLERIESYKQEERIKK